ncbi:MAG: T9SS type A sorting domain-containing protein [Saprospiraceae bacterium]|nr:T9SS type A sorting domain-containing protein [Saprospiraceae bacterium]
MKKIALISLISFSFFSKNVHAQWHSVCGNSPEWEPANSEANLQERKRDFEARMAKATVQDGWITSRSPVTIPVVVHILWNKPEENIDDARIWSQIERLNADFNAENPDLGQVPDEFKTLIGNPGIHFCLAGEAPDGSPANGIIRKHTDISGIASKPDLIYYSALGGSDAWDTERYLNIWVADNTPEPGSLAVTGYSSFPWNETPANSGVVISLAAFGKNNSESWSLGRVGVHEVGHYLGLRHTWGDQIPPSCDDDDGISDTPGQFFYYYGCPDSPQQSCGNSNMYMNYMDYVDDPCMVMFTKEQGQWMNTVLALYRPGLLNDNIQCIQKSEQILNTPFSVFPNPAGRQLYLNFPDAVAEPGDVMIYNALGHVVFRKFFILHSGMEINLPELASGMYFVKVGKRVEKVILHP